MLTQKTLILEYDDFHPNKEVNCLSTIQELVSLVPEIKLTMFTPSAYKLEPMFKEKDWTSAVRDLIKMGNLKLAVHGFRHTIEEFRHISYADAMNSLSNAEQGFHSAELPFLKVFRGPHWGINEATYMALLSRRYTHVYTHTDYALLAEKYDNAIRNVFYNWNLKDEAPESPDVLIAHGHTHSVCSNGIVETKERLLNFIKKNKPKFAFVDEV